MSKFTGLTCGLLSIAAFQAAHAVENKECTIEFKLGSSVVLQNKSALDDCLAQIDNNSITAVTIVGSASPTGPAKLNKKLAQERAQTMEGIVKAKFPEALIKKVSAGVNKELGKSSQITFIMKDVALEAHKAQLQEQVSDLQQKNETLQSEIQTKEQAALAAQAAAQDEKLAAEKNKPFSEGNPNFRVALRTGVNSTRESAADQRNYATVGAEAAWTNRDSAFRPEVGAQIDTSIGGIKIQDDTVANITNSYGFVGVGTTALGFVTGIRGLVGYEWINIGANLPEDNRFALGGEARIGYEWKRGPSVFASYALTERLQMIGLDIGVSL